MTGPSITTNQISNAMANWTTLVNSNKLVLGVRLQGIIELTRPTEVNLESNSAVPRDSSATILTSVIGDASPYIDACTFQEDPSLKVGSCSALRSAEEGPLVNSCTAGNGWTRKFDPKFNSTFLYKVSNTSLEVGSSKPLSRYFYITYEDSQTIQYKTQIIMDNSYGGIAMLGLTEGCDDVISSINAIVPVAGFSPPPEKSSGTDAGSVALVILGVLILFGGGCFAKKKKYIVVYRRRWW